MIRTALVLFATALSMPAFAQDDAPPADDAGRQIKYKERTEIDFEGVDVTGELVKPEGSLLLDRRKANFNPLIKLRENWDTEMKESVDDIK